jgi:hypothetical protein
MFGAGAPVEDQENEGSECKIVDKATDEGPGHFGEVQFEVAQIFYKNGANDNIPNIEDNQEVLKAFRVALIEKNPNEKKRRVQDKQIDGEDQQMNFPGSQFHWKRLRLKHKEHWLPLFREEMILRHSKGQQIFLRSNGGLLGMCGKLLIDSGITFDGSRTRYEARVSLIRNLKIRYEADISYFINTDANFCGNCFCSRKLLLLFRYEW